MTHCVCVCRLVHTNIDPEAVYQWPWINLHTFARQHNYQSILCFMNHDILFVMQCGTQFIEYFLNLSAHLNLNGEFGERTRDRAASLAKGRCI